MASTQGERKFVWQQEKLSLAEKKGLEELIEECKEEEDQGMIVNWLFEEILKHCNSFKKWKEKS